MIKPEKLPRDINARAAKIVAISVGDEIVEESKKNPAAVSLGRLGGLKGGRARAKKLSPAERKQIARKAAQKRWKKRSSKK